MRLSSIIFALSLFHVSAFAGELDNTRDYSKRTGDAYWSLRKAFTDLNISPQWSADGKHVMIFLDEGGKFSVVDAETGKAETKPDWKNFGELWKNAAPEGKMPKRGSRGIETFLYQDGVLKFKLQAPVGSWWQLSDEGLVKIDSPLEGQKKEAAAADQDQKAAPKPLVKIQDGEVILATDQGVEKSLGSVPAGGSYQPRVSWSPKSDAFILNFVIPGDNRQIYMVESSPKDQVQPKLKKVKYRKPGDKVTLTEPHVYFTDGSEPIFPNRDLFPNSFSISQGTWKLDGRRVEFDCAERGIGRIAVIGMDVESREQRVLLEETDERFINQRIVSFRQDLPETGEVIWGSDRDGWRHLYLLDADTFEVKKQITKGEWHVRDIVKVDEQNREIIFSANGREKDQDPYHIHYYRAGLDGSNVRALTQADGTHEISFNPSGTAYVDKWSRVDMPTVWELRKASDASLLGVLGKTTFAGEDTAGKRLPERFSCKDRNGQFDIWGVIHYPPNFDPSKSYPVLEQIYAGPHGAFVPKSFRFSYGRPNNLAEFGFVVVQIDGLGTAFRHPDFSKFSYKNLVDSGFPDRIKWMKEAAKTRPWMDLDRVGIYGGSAGGQSTVVGLLHHGEFYKAGVSDCGCHDNRVDKMWWNEQWMDWPIGPHYKEQSNVTNAHKLKGKLLLTVGELDTNVDPASTMQVADALIAADKDFELLVMTGKGHGSGENPYAARRRLQFFKRHLGDPE